MATQHVPGPLVIAGSSLAGVRAAEGARAHGWTGEIIMVGAEHHPPYDRPPLSKALLGAADEPTVPVLRHPDSWEELGVELHGGTAAVGIDVDRRLLITSTSEIAYGALVIATGGAARTVVGLSGFDNIHTLRTFDDAVRVRAALDTARRIVVLGAGFIGSEVASAAVARGIDVTIVNESATPLRRSVGPRASGALADLHQGAGVRLITGTRVVDISLRANRIRSLITDDGDVLDADAVFVGIGSVPASGWVPAGDIAVDPPTRAVVCDSAMATSAPAIWAAGDVATVSGRVGGHWTSASDQGFVAGANAVGAQRVHDGIPFAWSTWYGHRIQIVGDTAGSVLETVDDDLILSHRDGRVVGAVGIDTPGRIARLRRDLANTAAAA
ncbi:FAD-dependent oxidoreductase [Gordonia sp. ABSL11-1]|uniref:NAD(P)/FAD-dependent oxidoreductase n=1 Tax=Gordonia sp. ABSL11-1 TaxID=3053924 RepID=UPI00257371B4|nr:FAD-dependent oxidoreductase [Gordonia sp. ABSL11-1]MDL9945619.1 FAD-dependent oxidoreductase [Gordonia sp. ABSL11-1]